MRQFQPTVFFVSLLILTASLIAPGPGIASSVKGRQQQLPSGISWAQQAMAALTGGNPVNSVSEGGSVTRGAGNNQELGTITLQSTGIMTDQIAISTNAGNRSETRSWDGSLPSGQWTGLDGQPHQMAQQNCWTDAVWFFPALSLLSDYSDPSLVFTDLGQQRYSGGFVEHIQVYRDPSNWPDGPQQVLQRLSTVDYYLDSQTSLPVAMSFSAHGDQNVNYDVPIAVVFSQYQSIGGIQIPFQVTELLNGSAFLQITITSAVPNGQGLSGRRH